MKQCTKCSEIKKLNEFHKHSRDRDGLQSQCKKCRREYLRLYRFKNKERENNRKKGWALNNPLKIKRATKEYRKRNPDILRISTERNRIKRNKRQLYLKRTKPLYKLKCLLRSRIWEIFKAKSWHKNGGSEKLLGCTYEIAKSHIENLFTKGMSWDNHGKWHIDHKIPLVSAKNKEELIKLCHYKNLQPLWAYDNLSKGGKIF